MVKIAISGGGTGGHIYPAVAIAGELLKLEPEAEIIFIGGRGKRESLIVPQFGLDFVPILVEGFPRRLSYRWMKVAVKVPLGLAKSLMILEKFAPQVVIGTGGYVCGPVLMGALILHIPVLIQEQNVMPGITNRIIGRWADEIHVPFPSAAKFFTSYARRRMRITANPIRPEIMTATDGREKLGLDRDKLTISFVGASQGASSINAAAVSALKQLTDFESSIQVIHQTGERDISTVKEVYSDLPYKSVVQPYFDAIEEVYSATDLIVCRSGAMTLAEITARGLPAILIPYPYATGDHQTFNARALEERGAAMMIKDGELNGNSLAQVLKSFIEDRIKLSDMAEKSKSLGQPGAAREIAKAALALAL
jgi:UDP-N-acetylglucosamine--N-acetylmuramyl-(pentapeptide) pyrophosphoryl-undecaprenol N-acetylglucosamine transferase